MKSGINLTEWEKWKVFSEGSVTIRRPVKPRPEMALSYIAAGYKAGRWSYSPFAETDFQQHREKAKFWKAPYRLGDTFMVMGEPGEDLVFYVRAERVNVKRLMESIFRKDGDALDNYDEWSAAFEEWRKLIPKEEQAQYGWDADPWIWEIRLVKIPMEEFMKETEAGKEAYAHENQEGRGNR